MRKENEITTRRVVRIAVFIMLGLVAFIILLYAAGAASGSTGTKKYVEKYRVQSDEAVAYAKGISLEQATRPTEVLDFLSAQNPLTVKVFRRLHGTSQVSNTVVKLDASATGDGDLLNPAVSNQCSTSCGFGTTGDNVATAAAFNDPDPTYGWDWMRKWYLGNHADLGLAFWIGAGYATDQGTIATISGGTERCRTVRNRRSRKNNVDGLETMWIKLYKRWCWSGGRFTRRYATRLDQGLKSAGALGQWKTGQVVSKGSWNDSNQSYSWAAVRYQRKVCVPIFGCLIIQEHTITASITAYPSGAFRKGN